MIITRLLVLVWISLGLLMSGCTTVGYYTQSLVGHSQLMLARQSVGELIVTADDLLKQRLQTAVEIRRFASAQLSLPDNNSYSTYVELKRDPPIWNVVAAEEFSLNAKQWCYPIIGCASYRGYFHKADAEKYANKLTQKGYDVAVISAAAYSTLGWFADPLTSAMFKGDDASLADLIFHELAHQQVYIKNNSRFNEAFASAVGEQGTLYWLEATDRKRLLQSYQTRLQVRDDFLFVINQAKKKLKELYAEDLNEEQMRQRKTDVFKALRADHKDLQHNRWNGKAWYGQWFSKPINNARLVAIGTYRDLVPDFVELFQRCDRDFSRFYRQVKRLGESGESLLQQQCL